MLKIKSDGTVAVKGLIVDRVLIDGGKPVEVAAPGGDLPYVDDGKIYASVDRAEWLICKRAHDLPEDVWEEFVSTGVKRGMWRHGG